MGCANEESTYLVGAIQNILYIIKREKVGNNLRIQKKKVLRYIKEP